MRGLASVAGRLKFSVLKDFSDNTIRGAAFVGFASLTWRALGHIRNAGGAGGLVPFLLNTGLLFSVILSVTFMSLAIGRVILKIGGSRESWKELGRIEKAVIFVLGVIGGLVLVAITSAVFATTLLNGLDLLK